MSEPQPHYAPDPPKMDSTPTVPSSSAIRLPDELLHKNRLQEHTQRSSIPLPIYKTINEGAGHAPKFRATVLVDGATYTSSNTFSNRRPAEQDVARLALACIVEKIKAEGCPLIYEDTVYCKSILVEFAMKMNLEKPTYHTIQCPTLLPVFVSSSVLKGVTYTGAPGRNKKEAERLAARAAIQSILGDSNSGTILCEIIKSKFRLYAELYKVKDSGHAHNGIVPLAVHSGNGQNPGNSSGIPLSKGKEVVGTNTLPLIAISEACSGQVTNHPVVPQPFHEFKTPKKDQNPGNSGEISLGKVKEVEGTNNLALIAIPDICSEQVTNHPVLPQPFHEFETPKQVQNPGNGGEVSLGKGKEVEGTYPLPPIAVSQTCSGQVTNHPVLCQPFHEFKSSKKEPPAEAISLPIVFVPAVLQQPLGAASSSTRKRNRKNKKRRNKKSRMETKMEVAVVLLNQAQPCSVAQ